MSPLYFNLVLSKMFSKNKSEGGCTSSFGGVLFTDRQPDERKSFGFFLKENFYLRTLREFSHTILKNPNWEVFDKNSF